MSHKLIFVKGVDDDLADAVEWYEDRQINLGLKFIKDWEMTLDYVMTEPLSFEIRHKIFRHANFKTFPFIIVFEIEKNTITIRGHC